MKTLYQRLSKNQKEKFNENAKNYEHTKERIEDALKNNFTWGTLRMTEAVSFYNFMEPIKPFDLSTFTNFFDNE